MRCILTWASQHLAVVAHAEVPGALVLERWSTDTWTEVATGAIDAAYGSTLFSPAVDGLYKVRAAAGGVSVYGTIMANPSNHFEYLVAANGTGVGTSFTYRPAPFIGAGSLFVQALTDGAHVTVNGGAPNTLSGPGGVLAVSTLVAGTTYHLTADAPVLAWMEVTPGNGTCDGTVMDVDHVPGLSTGADLDTAFLFRLTMSPNGCYGERRPDLDVMGYVAETSVFVDLWTPAGAHERLTPSVGRGERVALLTDAAPGTLVRIVTNQPVTVVHSHTTSEFAGESYSRFRLSVPTLGEGGACDPAGVLDHCAFPSACLPREDGPHECQGACGDGVQEPWELCPPLAVGDCPEDCPAP